MNRQYLIKIILIILIICSVEIKCNVLHIRNSQLQPLLSSFERDYRGCDAIVSSCGNKGKCCDEHDACYKKYNCNKYSWLFLWGNCHRCNVNVMLCVALKNPGRSSCCAAGNCGVRW